MSLSTGQLVYQMPVWCNSISALVHQANVGAVLLCGNWSYINWHNLIPSYRYCHMQSVDYFRPVAFMRLLASNRYSFLRHGQFRSHFSIALLFRENFICLMP